MDKLTEMAPIVQYLTLRKILNPQRTQEKFQLRH